MIKIDKEQLESDRRKKSSLINQVWIDPRRPSDEPGNERVRLIK